MYTFFKRGIAFDPNFIGKLEEGKYYDLISLYDYGGWMGEVETHTHNVVRSLDPLLDEMWMNYRQNVRKSEKRANKNGLSVIIDEGKHINDDLSDFLRIYYSAKAHMRK